MELSDFLMYSGFGFLLAGFVGAVLGIYKGYKDMDWSKVGRIAWFSKLRSSSASPAANNIERTSAWIIFAGVALVILSALVRISELIL